MTDIPVPPRLAPPAGPGPARSGQAGPDLDALRAAAEALEAGFLAEMLKQTSLGRTPSGFGGGPGEDAFASLMIREQAAAMAARGGIGLAERLFEAMARGRPDAA